jgi:hypothetical protein
MERISGKEVFRGIGERGGGYDQAEMQQSKRMVRGISSKGEFKIFICWFSKGALREFSFISNASNRSNLLPFWERCSIFTISIFVW